MSFYYKKFTRKRRTETIKIQSDNLDLLNTVGISALLRILVKSIFWVISDFPSPKIFHISSLYAG